jgi:hypothetical protein
LGTRKATKLCYHFNRQAVQLQVFNKCPASQSGKKEATSLIRHTCWTKPANTPAHRSAAVLSENLEFLLFKKIGVAIVVWGMVEFTRGMSKQASSLPTALGQWRPTSSLRTRQSGGLHGRYNIRQLRRFKVQFLGSQGHCNL